MGDQFRNAAKPNRNNIQLPMLVFTIALAITSFTDASQNQGGVESMRQQELSANDLTTFGTAGKEGKLYPDHEVDLFRHTGAGCMTHMWFGGDWPGYGRTRIRFYVDGEVTPSIDMELFFGHGIGWNDSSAPWGTERLGKTGQPSGLYNTYRIPFGKSIRITGQLGPGVQKPQTFWWIFRGIENLPVYLGKIRLPDNARLRLQVHSNVALEPLQMIDIAQSTGHGALYQVTLAVASKNLDFLEGMMRAYMDGAAEPLLLSSGTEDYFLGTYYFNRGLYHLPMAGLTHKKTPKHGTSRFSAYRFHEDDPVIFQKGFRLVWRNGEENDGKPYAPPHPTELTSYVWLYEW
ncbi:MAG: DUF2961 domain-containing protein [Terriglobia bacterium]